MSRLLKQESVRNAVADRTCEAGAGHEVPVRIAQSVSAVPVGCRDARMIVQAMSKNGEEVAAEERYDPQPGKGHLAHTRNCRRSPSGAGPARLTAVAGLPPFDLMRQRYWRNVGCADVKCVLAF
jgi:hypothetical protein